MSEFDFDDANDFLSAISELVPSMDASPDWNMDLQMFPDQRAAQPAILEELPSFWPSLPAVLSASDSINTDGIFVAETDSAASTHPTPARAPGAPAPGGNLDPILPPVSSAALATFGGLASHTPITHYLSFLKLPQNNATPRVKREYPHAAQVTPPDHHGSSAESPSVKSETTSHVDSQGSPLDMAESLRNAVPLATDANRVSKLGKKTKISHNMIEKRYRTNINSKIIELRDAVPSLRIATGKTELSVADLEGLVPALKLNKALVLMKANEYIKHLERKNSSLQDKISALQELISLADGSPTVAPMASATTDLHLRGYALSPPAANYMAQPLVPPTMATARPMQMSESAANSVNFNMLLGGFATVMGSSFISDDNFSAMSAIPILPLQSLFKAATPQMVSTLHFGVWACGLAMMAASLASVFLPRNGKLATLSPTAVAAKVLAGLGHAATLSAARTADCATALQILKGEAPAGTVQMFKLYVALWSHGSDFESLLLRFALGLLLVKQHPTLFKVLALHMRWCAHKLTSVKYDGDNAYLKRCCKLVHFDGLEMFRSADLLQHMDNLRSRRPICAGIQNGENRVDFVDFYLMNKSDYYAVLFHWRVLEMVHAMNVVYLTLFTELADTKKEQLDELKIDVDRLSLLTAGCGALDRHLALFKLLIIPESAPRAFQAVENLVLKTVDSLNQHFRTPELTDGELSEDEGYSSSSDNTEDGLGSVGASSNSAYEKARLEKSMICSMNLMNEQKFIVLVLSLMLYYAEVDCDEKKVLAMVQHLRFRSDKTLLSLLSFTSIIQILNLLVRGARACSPEGAVEDLPVQGQCASVVTKEAGAVLERLVKVARNWLNDDARASHMSFLFREELTNFVMSKSMALNDL